MWKTFEEMFAKGTLLHENAQIYPKILSAEQKIYLKTALNSIPPAETTLFQAIENRLNDIFIKAYNEEFPKHIIRLIIDTLALSAVLSEKQKKGILETSKDIETFNSKIAKLRQQIE